MRASSSSMQPSASCYVTGRVRSTTRAVTNEAGCAKGVLHRHFTDLDAFLAELVLDRIAWIDDQAAVLRDSAGTGTVNGNLTGALTAVFGSVALVARRPRHLPQ